MAINWAQVGEDFEQKYLGTFCRYVSPVTKERELFSLLEVVVHDTKAPDLTLFNDRHGEIFLRYTGEAELDFTFPEMGNFQHNDRCLRLERSPARQWRKGLCPSTIKVNFPYSRLYPAWSYSLDEKTLTSAFNGLAPQKISSAVKALNARSMFSVALSPTLSLGLGEKAKTHWLWFEEEPVGEVEGETVTIYNPLFIQEVNDFIRDTGDNVRAVQASPKE